MLIRIFTLRFSDAIEGFDDESLRAFMADKEIISVREHFFLKDNIPYWSVMLIYTAGSQQKAAAGKTDHIIEEKKEDYRSLLDDRNMPLFNLIREWRNERALKDGVPPYVLFTNRQLAEIASKSPQSLNQLSAVEGVGKSKIEKYGNDILRIIQSIGNQAEQAVKGKAGEPQKTVHIQDTLLKEAAQKDSEDKHGT